MSEVTEAIESIQQHEGLRLKPYKCPADKLTIGYGRNLEDVGITESEAMYMLTHDVQECFKDLGTFTWFDDLSDNRKVALVDMRYNLGGAGFRKFQNMIAAIKEGDYLKAANEMLDSLWSVQVGQRAMDLALLMEEG